MLSSRIEHEAKLEEEIKKKPRSYEESDKVTEGGGWGEMRWGQGGATVSVPGYPAGAGAVIHLKKIKTVPVPVLR